KTSSKREFSPDQAATGAAPNFDLTIWRPLRGVLVEDLLRSSLGSSSARCEWPIRTRTPMPFSLTPILPCGVTGAAESPNPCAIDNRLCIETTRQRAERKTSVAVKACGTERVSHCG